MIDEAIARINNEMQQHPSDKMLEAVGQYLIDICTDEATAEKLLDEKKTIAGAVAAMREAARKKQHGGYYAMAPEEAWEIVRGDYGIKEAAPAQKEPESAAKPGDSAAVDIDFDSFWG